MLNFLENVLKEHGGDSFQFGSIDWATLTFPMEHIREAMDAFDYLRRMEEKNRYQLKPFTSKLMNGKRIGSVQIGTLTKAPQVGLVTVSGSLSQILLVWGISRSKATRVDVAIDCFFPKRDSSVRVELERYYAAYEYTGKHAGKLTSYRSPNGGYTLYYGKRGGNMMLRVYDKGAHLEGRRDLWWRYELQFGREYAERARSAMVASDDVTKWMLGVMVKFCDDRGIYFPNMYNSDIQWITCSRIKTDNSELEKRTVWFNSVVVPFVKRFIAVKGEDYVADALGFHLERVYGDLGLG